MRFILRSVDYHLSFFEDVVLSTLLSSLLRRHHPPRAVVRPLSGSLINGIHSNYCFQSFQVSIHCNFDRCMNLLIQS
ncbi:hypothetical protein K1719_040692 [Acacia pycnantha]|nr:hypothetical protein K1719_040692 [Acacia pycnantha]